jgi:hypothetical protein
VFAKLYATECGDLIVAVDGVRTANWSGERLQQVCVLSVSMWAAPDQSRALPSNWLSAFLGRLLPSNSNGIHIIGARVGRTRSGAADKSLACKLLTFDVGELCMFRLFWGRPAASAV